MKTIAQKIMLVAVVCVTAQLSAQTTIPDAETIDIWNGYMPTTSDEANPNYWNGQSTTCHNKPSSWVLGGNFMKSLTPFSNIGTCNDYPFILKANNFPSVFIQPSGFIGINNPSPAAALDILNPVTTNQTSFRIYGDQWGTVQSLGHISMVYGLNADFTISEGTAFNSPTDHFTIHNGNVGIDESIPAEKFHVNGNTRITGNLGIGAYPALEKLHVAGGNMRVDGHAKVNGNLRVDGTIGVNGNPSDGYKVDIVDATGSSLRVLTTSNNTAKLSVTNGASGYDFFVNGAGLGGIHSGTNSILNFKPTGMPGSMYPQVWIGTKPTTAHTDFNLAVGGKIVTQVMVVTQNCGWADYVFADDYNLPKLQDVEKFYRANKHLPEIPSVNEITKNGIDVAEMNELLLKKIEELTLYAVEQQKQSDQLQKEVESLKRQISCK